MTTPNSSKGSFEEEKTEKVTTSSLQQTLDEVLMTLREITLGINSESSKVRKLLATIFPEIEKVLNAGKISLAESAVKIEGGYIETEDGRKEVQGLKNTFKLDTTTFPGRIALYYKNEEGEGFVNKSGERAFDSILSLGDNYIATKLNGKVVLENLKTGVYIEWAEEAHTLIDEKTYKSKINSLHKNRSKLQYVSRGNYHNLMSVLNSISTSKKILLLGEIDEVIKEQTDEELIQIICKSLELDENSAYQILDEVRKELLNKNNGVISEKLGKTIYPELRKEVIKSILSDPKNRLLDKIVSHFYSSEVNNPDKKIEVNTSKGYIIITKAKGSEKIDFNNISVGLLNYLIKESE